MNERERAFHKRLLSTFREEAADQLDIIRQSLLVLEAGEAAPGEQVERIFRATHSLKGAARAVGLKPIMTVCAALEEVFSELKQRGTVPAVAVCDAAHGALRLLGELVVASSREADEGSSSAPVAEVVRRLEEAGREAKGGALPGSLGAPLPAELPVMPSKGAAPAGEIREPVPRASASLRIPARRLDAVLQSTEVLLDFQGGLDGGLSVVNLIEEELAVWERACQAVQPTARALRHGGEASRFPTEVQSMVRLLGHVEQSQAILQRLQHQVRLLRQAAVRERRMVERLLPPLFEDVKVLSLQPFGSLFHPMAAFVRDLAQEQGKQVRCVVEGADLEVDRRVLEGLQDVLMHLLRNAMDHGIETPAERLQSSKPAGGTLRLTATREQGGHVEVVVADDGAGVDVAQVRGAAVRKGICSPETAAELSEQEVTTLLFESGLTTRTEVTELSGRGLGLAIVREKTERLGGHITLASERGRGSAFRLLLPVAQAMLRSIVVRLGDCYLAVPVVHVERVRQIQTGAVQLVGGRPAVLGDEQPLAVAWLADLLDMPRTMPERDAESRPAVVLQHEKERMGLIVDEVVEEREVLVRGLGPQLARVPHIAGAVQLGAGRMALLLQVSELFAASRSGRMAASPADDVAAAPRPRRRRVLVAEDSITSRTLLKSILEMHGYEVDTAVDGLEALTRLRSGDFDALVSDIDMPRMNGFTLTARLREEAGTKELPVILVTALSSPEDHRRGVEAGADAYLIKSSFDQSDLLETLERFL